MRLTIHVRPGVSRSIVGGYADPQSAWDRWHVHQRRAALSTLLLSITLTHLD
ncbi:unannotated protein [freshwater metagenome]|uniref:Unannotated protein n=1 Tax=freshwater metagenome TaxID=449393 RepID=A0A6J7I681_9ZZZZ